MSFSKESIKKSLSYVLLAHFYEWHLHKYSEFESGEDDVTSEGC
jgi:hypothetical protein